MKQLIVTADDFGLTPGVVAGVIDAYERGIVTATSLMVNVHRSARFRARAGKARYASGSWRVDAGSG